MKYKVVVEPQEEGGYTVYVPTLPGCISQGASAEETMVKHKRGYRTLPREFQRAWNTFPSN